MEKEKKLIMLQNQSRKWHNTVRPILQEMYRKTNQILLVIKEMEKETGAVKKTAVVNEVAAKYKTPIAEIELMLTQLLREGRIYEPKEGYLRIT